ncbi:hypothetical protein ACFORL_06555 [Legionella dresdenensis]|uniref:tRNA-guanine(15) transglycosylase-like domain-containing protein n=1 Tax=Legionella dresdenensis TaxID=450200 RepID=A0ABV8CET7_9GAMM
MSQHKQNQIAVPVSTTAGSCLTWDNLAQAKAETIVLALDEMLMKPGIDVLKQLVSLKDYYHWQGRVVIDASLLPLPNREGVYSIKSRYEGNVIRIATEDLCRLLRSLAPDILILPASKNSMTLKIWQDLPETISCYTTDGNYELSGNFAGYCLYFDDQQSGFTDFVETINLSASPLYLKGNFTSEQLAQVVESGHIVESNRPAEDGMSGIIYTAEGDCNILDSTRANEHTLLDKSCTCPVCSQQLTRAYFHHLLQQTPLLAQRFLILHNLFYSLNHSVHLRKP